MSFKIVTTAKAQDTFLLLTGQLRQRWGEGFVIEFEKKIEKSVKMISASPYTYPIIEENTELRKCVLHKNCSMLYGFMITLF